MCAAFNMRSRRHYIAYGNSHPGPLAFTYLEPIFHDSSLSLRCSSYIVDISTGARNTMPFILSFILLFFITTSRAYIQVSFPIWVDTFPWFHFKPFFVKIQNEILLASRWTILKILWVFRIQQVSLLSGTTSLLHYFVWVKSQYVFWNSKHMHKAVFIICTFCHFI